jgi:hydrogenase maturation factor
MASEPPTFCATDHGCITCADVGVEVSVVRAGADDMSVCIDANGAVGEIDTGLVGSVKAGDRLLVHAGVAIARPEAAR